MKFKLGTREQLQKALIGEGNTKYHNQFVEEKFYPLLIEHAGRTVTPQSVAMLVLRALADVTTEFRVAVFDDFEAGACVWLGDLCGGNKEAWRQATIAWEKNWRDLLLSRFPDIQPYHRRLCWEAMRMELAHPTVHVGGGDFRVLACSHTDVDCFVYAWRKKMRMTTFDRYGNLLKDTKYPPPEEDE